MQHSNDEHYPESSPKPSPRGLRHAKEAFLHAPRAGGSICCLQRAMTPRVASDIRTDLPHRSTSGLSNGRRIRMSVLCPSGDRYGTRIERLEGVPFDGTALTDPATTCLSVCD